MSASLPRARTKLPRAAWAISLLALAGSLFGCVQRLPRAEAPAPSVPSLEGIEAPEAGHGRIVVDIVEGPAAVYRLGQRTVAIDDGKDVHVSATFPTREHLCDAPCAIDLPFGRYRLGFPIRGHRLRLESEVLEFGPTPFLYRRSLGTYEAAGAGKILGILGATFGGMSAATGLTLLPVGLANGSEGLTLAGAITLGAGAALLTLGIVGIVLSPSIERPGVAIQVPLP